MLSCYAHRRREANCRVKTHWTTELEDLVTKLALAGVSSIMTIVILMVSPAHAVGAQAEEISTRSILDPNGLKGKPPLRSSSTSGTLVVSTAYFYSEAYQLAVADGAFAWITVTKPAVSAGDYHSLAEIAVSSSDSRQVVEVGWTVDRSLNGDSYPHLFVFHWVDDQPTCYNACGFVRYYNQLGYYAGMRLPLSAVGVGEYFSIRHSGGNWWIAYNNQYIGYYPDSLWSGAFTKSGGMQWFGEVAASTAAPCTDMGNGAFAASATASRMYNAGLWGATVQPNLTARPATNAAYYTVVKSDSRSVRFGGPGAC
jgi:neprosin-like protein